MTGFSTYLYTRVYTSNGQIQNIMREENIEFLIEYNMGRLKK